MKNIVYILFIFSPVLVAAQKKPTRPAPVTKSAPSNSPDTLLTSLGFFRGKSMPIVQLKPFIDSALKARDQSGNFYPIESFEFNYRQKEESVNDETSRKETFFYTVQCKAVGPFLPEMWRRIVKEKLKPDEIISFEKIFVKLPNGKLMIAPPLFIKVL